MRGPSPLPALKKLNFVGNVSLSLGIDMVGEEVLRPNKG